MGIERTDSLGLPNTVMLECLWLPYRIGLSWFKFENRMNGSSAGKYS